MAQAHRVKIDPPAIRVGIYRFINSVLRESGFWLLAALALGLIGALATFNPADPAWTHTASVARLHNPGGVAGAWFADITLYFFGYPAYLLPLALAFSGWRLFKCGGLLDLDGEIVLFRALGFFVALATACGLATLHLRVMPGTVPDLGTAGGLVGVHVSQFLIRAFGFAGGHLFMAALLLAGMMLATGVSWLAVLDGVGSVTLKTLDWVGGLALAPLRWFGPATKVKAADDVAEVEPGLAEPEATTDPVAESGTKTVLERLTDAWRLVTERSSLWRRSQRTRTKAKAEAEAEAEIVDLSPSQSAPSRVEIPPAPVFEEATVLPGGRPSRIEPVLNWPTAESEPLPVAAAVVSEPIEETVLEAPYLDMLTLLPVAPPVVPPPAPAASPPVPPEPASPSVQTPWQPGNGLVVAAPPSSAPPVANKAEPVEFPVDEEPVEDFDWTSIPPVPVVSPPVASPPVAVMVRRVTPPPQPIPYLLPPLDLLDPPPPSRCRLSPHRCRSLQTGSPLI